MAYLAGGLLVAAAPASGQTVPDASSNSPATDAIGPRELQNFSLPGTTTKATEQPAQSTAIPGAALREAARSQAKPQDPAAAPASRTPVAEAARETKLAPTRSSKAGAPRVASEAQAPVFAPPAAVAVAPVPAPAPSAFIPGTIAGAPVAATPPPARGLPVLPWLIAALAALAGAIFLLWRRSRQRAALATGPEYDLFVPPQADPVARPPIPAPRAAERPPQPIVPAPPSSPAPAAVPEKRLSGIVASRLRPSIELAMQPLRCLVDDDEVTIEFEVEIFNSGSVPARAVIAEASLLNASASHEQELAAFYAKPLAVGDSIDSIPPMRRMTFTNRVVTPRAQVQEYELSGRKAFIPVLAFNARYEWSGGKGQSALAFLLGRETRGDKLGPLHLDGARREVRGLGARVLPTAVRT